MTIEKNGNKWRVSKMRGGVRYRVSVDHKPTIKEAEKLIAEKMRLYDPVSAPGDTFLFSAEKYLAIKEGVLSPSTLLNYRSIIKNMSDSFKGLKTANITQEHVQKEVSSYARTHSAKSTHNLHGFISAVLGVYHPNLRLNTSLPQKVKFDAYTPTEDEVKKVLSAVSGSEFEIVYRLGVYGLRRGEICALSSADLDGNILKVNKSKVLTDNGYMIKPIPKTTGSQREIYIDNDLADLIRQKKVVFSKNPDAINKHLHRLEKALSLPAFRFHDLRAYYASMAHSLGIPDAYIMANGGWTSTNILNRVYKRAFADKQNEANRAIAEHLTIEKAP